MKAASTRSSAGVTEFCTLDQKEQQRTVSWARMASPMGPSAMTAAGSIMARTPTRHDMPGELKLLRTKAVRHDGMSCSTARRAWSQRGSAALTAAP